MAFHPNNRMDPQTAAEKAVSVMGFGYDMAADIRLSACKPGPSGSGLIELDRSSTEDLIMPGGVVVRDVSTSIKCDKGERTRFRSDALTFNQMSEQFNQDVDLSGKIPSGLFNTMFDHRGCWQKDAASTKLVAFDGWFITLYNVELERCHVTLCEQVRREVPSSWDPPALAEFIEKYGTHVVVGLKMGGKDVIHIKQLQKSTLEPIEVQKLLKQLADEKFSEDGSEGPKSNPDNSNERLKDEKSIFWDPSLPFASSMRPSITSHSKNNDIVSIHVRRGGSDCGQSHSKWLSTVSQSPNVISMSFVPIASLLNGVKGSGFLSHAINLYLRYKPPIEELLQFLEFQLPRRWAPAYSDLPLVHRRRKQASPSLQFTFMGPKLFVNTVKVDSGNRPVTGIRLYLEGKRSDHLAIHLQHLSALPESLQLTDDHTYEPIDVKFQQDYFEPVKWSIFSHVCTAPIEYQGARIDDFASIVTKAWFEVKVVGMKKVLFLRLGFSMVSSALSRRAEWDEPSNSARKSGLISMLITTPFSTKLTPPEKPAKADLNSAIYPAGPPTPAKPPKMSHFVDTKEMVRGPEDSPGYWMVTGARLFVEDSRIRIKVKYSLLTILSEDSLM
ncbi:MACPF domain-containing protein NSL1-like [Ipomoea triloba]|uniref:MACPF domain-containing protein NSL1-like n=1 Tax=Ipomoea triloba TaxID=35885 RepID=UPI00125E4B8A|nr:MACPF domain-containing protein NSL1-like [Ipomoea triloba]